VVANINPSPKILYIYHMGVGWCGLTLAVVMEKVFMMGLGLFKNKKFKKSN
jgi:hypothetical protein